MPGIDDVAQPATEFVRLSCVSSPAAGSSMHTSFGRAASARAAETSLRWPWLISFGHPLGEIADAEHVEGEVDTRGVAARVAGATRSSRKPPIDWRSAATCRFSSTVRSSNSSSDCQVRPRPERGAPVGRQRSRSRARRTLDAAGGRHEAGDAVDERRLAGAVRTDEADELALMDLEVDVVDGAQAAEGDRHAVGVEQSHQLGPISSTTT